jgi:phosphate transport system permease protein
MSEVRLRRKAVNVAMLAATGLCALVVATPIALILYYVVAQGLPALSWRFLTSMPKPVGEPGGGMANAIVGSGILVGLACAMGLPVGILVGVCLAEFGGGKFGWWVRFAADVLNGVPSIVTGIFVYALVVLAMGHFSALAGAVALALMLVPMVARTTEEMLSLVPSSLREGAMALGATRARTVFTVLLPAALGGVTTGVLLAVARVAGETAPLLFTAFGNRFWSTSLAQPIASLPVQIYTYAIAPYDDWHAQAWAGALVLVAVSLLVSAAARLLAARQVRRVR